MLHYVHQLVANFLPCGAGQVAYSSFTELFLLKQLPAVAGNKVDDSVICRVEKPKQHVKKDAKTLCNAEGTYRVW